LTDIEIRQKYISEFAKNKILLDKVRDELTYVSDIDAILNRIALNRANPRDLLNLKRSLESIIKVVELIKNSESKQLKKLFKIK
jgi:DNA mismatch repair protein MutS